MADVTDPRALKFVKDVVRVLAEQKRADKAEIDSAVVTWEDGMEALFRSDNLSGAIQDGRESEGVSRLVVDDVRKFMDHIISVKTADDVDGVSEIISRPTVRPLRVK